MIYLLWDQWFDLWKIRNDEHHGCDAVSQTKAHHDQVLHEITMVYDKKCSVLAAHREIFAGETKYFAPVVAYIWAAGRNECSRRSTRSDHRS